MPLGICWLPTMFRRMTAGVGLKHGRHGAVEASSPEPSDAIAARRDQGQRDRSDAQLAASNQEVEWQRRRRPGGRIDVGYRRCKKRGLWCSLLMGDAGDGIEVWRPADKEFGGSILRWRMGMGAVGEQGAVCTLHSALAGFCSSTVCGVSLEGWAADGVF